jgi:hypothetical protein
VLTATANGAHILRAGLTVRPGGIPVGAKFSHLPRPKNEKAPYWSGTITSNDVQIKIKQP